MAEGRRLPIRLHLRALLQDHFHQSRRRRQLSVLREERGTHGAPGFGQKTSGCLYYDPCFILSFYIKVGTIISEKIPVTVAYMSAFTPTPTPPLRIAAGRAAIFDFPPISSVPLPAVTWQADDGSGLHGRKFETTTDNRLVILSVDSGDSKKYRCGPAFLTPSYA